MAESFDPYQEWLGIPPDQRPVDHYRLLGLAVFESDANRIQVAADKRMALIRSFQTGPRGHYTQKLLNEIASAKLCLLNATSKAKYDSELLIRQCAPPQLGAPPPPVPPVAPPVAPPPRVAGHGQANIGLDVRPKRRSAKQSPRSSAAVMRYRVAAASLMAVAAIALIVWLAGRQFSATSDTDRQGENRPSKVESSGLAKPRTSAPDRSDEIVVEQESSGEFHFPMAAATLVGPTLRRETMDNEVVLSGWSSPDDVASWRFKLIRPGVFRMRITYTIDKGKPSAGTRLSLAFDGDQPKSIDVRDEVPAGEYVTDEKYVALPRVGQRSLQIHIESSEADAKLILKAVELVPRNPRSLP